MTTRNTVSALSDGRYIGQPTENFRQRALVAIPRIWSGVISRKSLQRLRYDRPRDLVKPCMRWLPITVWKTDFTIDPIARPKLTDICMDPYTTRERYSAEN